MQNEMPSRTGNVNPFLNSLSVFHKSNLMTVASGQDFIEQAIGTAMQYNVHGHG